MAQHDRPASHSILVIDDNAQFCRDNELVFGRAGWHVVTVGTGREALSRIETTDFSLLIVDLRLPDLSGIEVLRQIPPDRLPPFFMISGFLETEIVFEAAKLGAVGVMHKPIDIFELLERVTSVMAGLGAAVLPTDPMGSRSAAERWAHYVMLASESRHDLPTLRAWAAFVNVSSSTLREHCRVAGLPAHQSRDFARMLRAVCQSTRRVCHPSVLLDVGDHRTLAALFDRAGLPCTGTMPVPLHAFLIAQRLVDPTSAAVRLVYERLSLRV